MQIAALAILATCRAKPGADKPLTAAAASRKAIEHHSLRSSSPELLEKTALG